MSRATIVTDAEGRFHAIRVRCPAGHEHVLAVDWTPAGMERAAGADSRPVWQFNGDLERPTLAPSILLRRGHYCNTPAVPGDCACDFQERYPDEPPLKWPCVICHSFVRDGRIQFLPDCTHALAGQTVDLPEIDAGGME